MPSFKKGGSGNYKLVSLTLIPRKILEHAIKHTICKHLDDSKVVRSRYHGFSKSLSCLPNLISFSGEVTSQRNGCKASALLVGYLCSEAVGTALGPVLFTNDLGGGNECALHTLAHKQSGVASTLENRIRIYNSLDKFEKQSEI